ncbi:MAG: tripartite tricarboxylate transporter substrate binding protein [Burkholderiales bacterium]|nr:tripartite tricarboxylate transporter substrate binding protein [Burkholderiales bacterium]
MRHRTPSTHRVHAVLLTLLLAGASSMLASASAHANDIRFPTRPVRFIVGNTAGSGADLAARIVARALTDAWKEPVVVDNRGGVGGLLAAEIVAKAEPDGQTLMLAQEGAIIIAPAIQRSTGVDPQKALVPVVNLADTDYVLIASAKSGIRSVDDLRALALKQPGQRTFASAGVGSVHHLGFEQLNQLLGISMVHVPFKGGPPGAAEVAAGNVDAMFVSPAAAMGFATAGRVSAIATGGVKRNPQFAAAPAIGETYKGFRVVSWFALFAPANTPSRVLEKIARDATEVVRSAEIRAQLAAQGINAVGGTPKQMADLVRSDMRTYGDTIKRLKITAE